MNALFSDFDRHCMRAALRLAGRAYGQTSPNPMVGAILVKDQQIIGRGWHHRAGLPHAEIEALQDARQKGHPVRGTDLYVTLEPCCTHGRTPPCTEAIMAAGIKRVIVAATDPNPRHRGKGLAQLRSAGIQVAEGLLANEAAALNEAFNHWIVHRSPWVTVKAAMTLDGKIATASGQSKWITGEKARAEGMRLRAGADAILVGINTILADNPALTVRPPWPAKPLRRIILDSRAQMPLGSQVLGDAHTKNTIIAVTSAAPKKRVEALKKVAEVWDSPVQNKQVDLRWLLQKLGRDQVTSLLVEGGGEVNASFLLGGLAHRVVFFYAPKILGGRTSRKAVAGLGAHDLQDALTLHQIIWRRMGLDLILTAKCQAT